jgi:hypothetical protein
LSASVHACCLTFGEFVAKPTLPAAFVFTPSYVPKLLTRQLRNSVSRSLRKTSIDSARARALSSS